MDSTLHAFLPVLKRMAASGLNITKESILQGDLLMAQSDNIEMYYSPHNEYINHKAEIVIVGITPGWRQMKTALTQFIQSSKRGDSLAQTLKKTKEAASFIGSMRTNLIKMLDACGLSHELGMPAGSLFTDHRHLLHTTSIIKYPLFYQGKNYTGYQPAFKKIPMLRAYINEIFPSELQTIPATKLIIPLGKVVDSEVHRLITDKRITNAYCLNGFPHPSGANGHRERIFSRNIDTFQSVIHEWAQKRKDESKFIDRRGGNSVK